MSERAFEPIYPNPYIVGNPIRSQEMFFGRLDEFNFIARSLEDGRKTALIVLFGERRSGKSSILYQILNGRLGDAFLPIFVDMQLMAGIASDAEFFGRIIADACKQQLPTSAPPSERFAARLQETTAIHVFREFLQELKSRFPDRAPLLLIDEYEFLEAKIKEGSLSRHLLTFFAGMLETDQVSFVFTGSKSLEAHDQTLWGEELFRKASSRKISFLTRDDTARLITQPVDGKVSFAPETIAHIYSLTAGQPFYIQMICQNLVYHLNEVRKSEVDEDDVQVVVDGILENPPPQLLFNWNEQSAERKLTLSMLAEFSDSSETFFSARELCHKINRGKLGVDLDVNFFNTEFSALYQDEYVLQSGRRYRFRMDLYRLWVRHDHNIWRVKKEIGPHEMARITKERRKKTARIKKRMTRVERGLLFAFIIAAVILGVYVYRILQTRVVVTANGGPFSVWVNDDSVGTTKGAKDSTRFEMPNELIKDFSYKFKLVLLASDEVWENSVTIEDNDQQVIGKFSLHPLKVITDAASIEARLGGAPWVTKKEDQPASWQYTFEACAGTYLLRVKDRNAGEVWQETITIPATSELVRIDFPGVAVVKLVANLYPFDYSYEWRDSHGRKKHFRNRRADSTAIDLRGMPIGEYTFTFTSPAAVPKIVITRNVHVSRDTMIAVEFKPGGRTDTPVTTTSGDQAHPTAEHTLRINSDPSGARVSIDGEYRGTTTFVEELQARRKYTVSLEMDGYDTDTRLITISKKDTINIRLTPQYGHLKLLVQDEKGRPLPDVEVQIDSQFKGKTRGPIMDIPSLLAIEHKLRLTRGVFVDRDTTFVISKGDTLKLPIRMRKRS